MAHPGHVNGRLALVAMVLPIALGSCSADGFFYHPGHARYAPPTRHGLAVEEVYFRAKDGTKLCGWWVPATGIKVPKGTVVFCHGKHGNIAKHLGSVAWLPRRGFNLLIFDYRGYGQSEGKVDRAGTVADTIAAIDFALARDLQHTVVFGHSLGGAVAIPAVAARPRVKAIAVVATFPSYRAAASAAAPALSWLTIMLISKGFEPKDSLKHLPPRPLLVIHGSNDQSVPLRLGKQLYALAPEPKTFYLIEDGGHRKPWMREGEKFQAMLCDFFEAAIKGQRY